MEQVHNPKVMDVLQLEELKQELNMIELEERLEMVQLNTIQVANATPLSCTICRF